MLRIDLLQDLADKKESNLLILPSSVNEVLLLAEEDNTLDMDSVKKMVEDINRDYVDAVSYTHLKKLAEEVQKEVKKSL